MTSQIESSLCSAENWLDFASSDKKGI